MYIKYRSELVLSVACMFAVFYPPLAGALVLLLSMAFLVVLSVTEKKPDPEFTALKTTVAELKSKIDHMILGRK